MEIFDSTKSIVENLYFLSGPVLSLLGIVAILQLLMTKKAMITNARREAANIAAQQIDVYNNSIIPLYNELFLLETKKKVSAPPIKPGPFRHKYLTQNMGEKKCLQIMEKRLPLTLPILQVLNAVEAFSTYFIKEVADEEIAFSAVGQTYCSSIESMFFDIASGRDVDDQSFQNMIELYRLWNNRLEKQSLLKEKSKITQKLENVQENKVNPIGTK